MAHRPVPPQVAALFGLAPGLGHLVAGRLGRALLFGSVGSVHAAILLFAAAWRWVPEVVLGLVPADGGLPLVGVARTLEAWVTPTTLGVLVAVSAILSFASAHDAFHAAKQGPDERSFLARIFAPALASSYGLHLATVAVAALLLMLGGRRGGDGSDGGAAASRESAAQAAEAGGLAAPFEVELTVAPTTIDGFTREREGGGEGAATRRAAGKDGVDDTNVDRGTSTADRGDDGDARWALEAIARGDRGEDAARDDGVGRDRSYNQYLSHAIRVHHGVYFRERRPFEYAVVRYTILADGSVVDVRALLDDSSGPHAHLAADSVSRLPGGTPLPRGTRRLEVTELFWSPSDFQPPAGGLAEELSRLPDGRRIVAIE